MVCPLDDMYLWILLFVQLICHYGCSTFLVDKSMMTCGVRVKKAEKEERRRGRQKEREREREGERGKEGENIKHQNNYTITTGLNFLSQSQLIQFFDDHALYYSLWFEREIWLILRMGIFLAHVSGLF